MSGECQKSTWQFSGNDFVDQFFPPRHVNFGEELNLEYNSPGVFSLRRLSSIRACQKARAPRGLRMSRTFLAGDSSQG
jgi:hypothetical protein